MYPSRARLWKLRDRWRSEMSSGLLCAFTEPFGKVIEKLSETGFLFSQNPSFPTWWTPNPVWAPVLTGWSAGQRPTRFIGMSRSEIVASALSSLQQILGMPALEPRAAYFHDWQADPFTRGAYSYVPAGALDAPERMARPVEDTLFFAGEHTDTSGHWGTVHAALTTGALAARQVLSAGLSVGRSVGRPLR